MITKIYPKVLTIAGSDSGGGAGIQADLKTFSALGCYGTSAITTITAQNTLGVIAIHPVPVDIVEKQITAVLDDIGTDAVKIGMVYSVQIVRAIAKTLLHFGIAKVVIDPVMVAASGDNLIEDDTVSALTRELFPLATLITPNLQETERIIGRKLITKQDILDAAKELVQYGNRAVVIKGFIESESIIEDVFYDGLFDEFVILRKERLDTINLHGTGCTYSSAIASLLAHDYNLLDAITHAKDFIHDAIINGKNFKTGKGHGPVNHFFRPVKLKEKLHSGHSVVNS